MENEEILFAVGMYDIAKWNDSHKFVSLLLHVIKGGWLFRIKKRINIYKQCWKNNFINGMNSIYISFYSLIFIDLFHYIQRNKCGKCFVTVIYLYLFPLYCSRIYMFITLDLRYNWFSNDSHNMSILRNLAHI